MTSELNVHYDSFKVSMLQILSKQEYYDLIMVFGNQPNKGDDTLTPDFIRNKLNLTKRESNSRIGMLMNLNLVDMSDNQYYLTKLGNEVCELLRMMETAIKGHQILDTTHTQRVMSLTN